MPANFEYKPLGFEAFAAPLEKMQGYYDATKGAIEDLDFQIQNLPFMEDQAAAKKLSDEMTAQRDELTNKLISSKDYRSAARDVSKLQKSWLNDPHKKALESNYAKWAELNKEQKARIGKEFSSEDYQEWRTRSIEEFKGTNFKEDDLDGKYSGIGRQARLADKTAERRKLSLEIAGDLEAHKTESFSRHVTGYGDIESVTKEMATLSKEEIADKVEGYLRSQPDFMDEAMEKADYAYWKLEKDPNTYNAKAKELVTKRVSDIDNAIDREEKRQEKSKSPDDKTLQALLKAKETWAGVKNSDEYDPAIVKSLFTEQQLDKTFDASEMARLYEVNDVSYKRSHSALPKTNNDSEVNSLAGFVPTTEEASLLSNLSTKLSQSNNALHGTTQKFNNIGGGALRKLSMGWENSEHRNKMKDDLGGQFAIQNRILAIRNTSKTPEEFHRNLWKAGIKEGNSKKSATAAFNALSPEVMQAASDLLSNSSQTFNDYNDSKTQLTAIKNDVSSLEEFPKFINTFEKQTAAITDKEWEMIKPKNFKFKQPGNVPLDLIAKAYGFKDVEEAMSTEKGRQILENRKMVKYGAGVTTVGDYYNTVIQGMVNKIVDKNIMLHRYVNDKKVEDGLSGIFLQTPDLTTFNPAHTKNWNNVPGFAEDGKLKAGTSLDITSSKKVHLSKQGNRLLYEVPYKYNDEYGKVVNSTITLQTKPGTDPFNKAVLDIIDDNTKNSDNELGQQTNDMVKAMKYDLVNGNSFTQGLFDAIPTPSKNYIDKQGNIGGEYNILESSVYSYRDGVNLEFIKINSGGKGKIALQLKSVDGERTSLTEGDQIKIFSDVNAAKVWAARNVFNY